MRMNVKKLISLVHSRPALWNQQHDDYNNKLYLKQLWEEIGEKMKCTADECKLKWRSLRDVFRRELKKYQSRLTNPHIQDKNLPRWFCFKELQFLTEHLTGIENVTDTSQENSDAYFESLYVKNEPDLLDDEELTLEADDDVLLTLTENSSRKSPTYTFQTTDSNQLDESQFDKAMKYYRDSLKRSSQEYVNEERSRKRIKAGEKNDREDDSDYHFLMSLLPFLKMIPQRRKMYLRTKIQNVICEEMEAGNEGS